MKSSFWLCLRTETVPFYGGAFSILNMIGGVSDSPDAGEEIQLFMFQKCHFFPLQPTASAALTSCISATELSKKICRWKWMSYTCYKLLTKYHIDERQSQGYYIWLHPDVTIYCRMGLHLCRGFLYAYFIMYTYVIITYIYIICSCNSKIFLLNSNEQKHTKH